VNFGINGTRTLYGTAHRILGPTQPPIQWVLGAFTLGVKWPGREADQSPPSSAEVRNAWIYTSTPQYVFMAWYLVKYRTITDLCIDKSTDGFDILVYLG